MNPKIKYILVGAAKRRGKDTFSNFVVDALGASKYPASRYSFADELRREVQAALREQGIRIDVWTEDAVLKEKVVRPLLIAWGQMRRFQDPDYWIKKLLGKVKTHSEDFSAFGLQVPCYYAIVSDWRFPNELSYILNAGEDVVSVHIDRPDTPYAGPDEQVNDPLCRDMAEFHINNTGDLESLRNKAELFVRNTVLKPLVNSL